MQKRFETATRKRTALHLDGEKGEVVAKCFSFDRRQSSEGLRGKKHTPVFTKAAEAGTHHILSRVIGHSPLIRKQRRLGSTPSNQSKRKIAYVVRNGEQEIHFRFKY